MFFLLKGFRSFLSGSDMETFRCFLVKVNNFKSNENIRRITGRSESGHFLAQQTLGKTVSIKALTRPFLTYSGRRC